MFSDLDDNWLTNPPETDEEVAENDFYAWVYAMDERDKAQFVFIGKVADLPRALKEVA